MQDPYRVLGVTRSASDDDIKKAYRKLSRIYHPDANVNNPNKKQAEEKFKEIQQAYDQIIKEKEGGYQEAGGGYGSGGYGSSGYGGYDSWFNSGYRRAQSSAGSSEPLEMQAARNYINSGHYREALNALSGVAEKDARWYYYSAIANAGLGNTVNAQSYAQQAVSMEPGNTEYADLLERLKSGAAWYQGMGNEYGGNPLSGNLGGWCWKIALFNILCTCCCRPFG